MIKKGGKILAFVMAVVLGMSMHISAEATDSAYVGSGSAYVGSGSSYTDDSTSGDTAVDSVISDSQLPEETPSQETPEETPVETPSDASTDAPAQEKEEVPAQKTTEDVQEESARESTDNSNAISNENTDADAEEAESITDTYQIPETDAIEDTESSVDGVYLGTAVDGCVVLTAEEDIYAGYGLQGNEKPYAKFLNLNKEKRPVSAKMLEMAAISQGATVGPMLNIEFGKLSADDKYNRLPENGSDIEVRLGIPGTFSESGTQYAVVCVRKDGSVFILEDLDTDDTTVTFKTTGGTGAYAIIKY